MNPAALAAGSGSDLEPLLEAWGIDFSAGEVVADNRYALSISTGLGLRPVRHLALLGITNEAMDSEDVTIDGLGNLNMGTSGHFTVLEDRTAELQPLLTSSTDSALLPSIQVQMLADPGALQDNFTPNNESYVLAARLTGEAHRLRETGVTRRGPPGELQQLESRWYWSVVRRP